RRFRSKFLLVFVEGESGVIPTALRDPQKLPVEVPPLVVSGVRRNYPAVTLDKAEIPIDYVDRGALRARRPAADYALLATKPDRMTFGAIHECRTDTCCGTSRMRPVYRPVVFV